MSSSCFGNIWMHIPKNRIPMDYKGTFWISSLDISTTWSKRLCRWIQANLQRPLCIVKGLGGLNCQRFVLQCDENQSWSQISSFLHKWRNRVAWWRLVLLTWHHMGYGVHSETKRNLSSQRYQISYFHCDQKLCYLDKGLEIQEHLFRLWFLVILVSM